MRDDVGLAGYTPLEAGSMSELEPFEREMVEVMRRDLWRRIAREHKKQTNAIVEIWQYDVKNEGARHKVETL